MWPWSGQNFSNRILTVKLKHKSTEQNCDTIVQIVKYGGLLYHFCYINFISLYFFFQLLLSVKVFSILSLLRPYMSLWNAWFIRNKLNFIQLCENLISSFHYINRFFMEHTKHKKTFSLQSDLKILLKKRKIANKVLRDFRFMEMGHQTFKF